jgi:hypoxanthine phosphoribosyltransferase
MLFSNKVVPQNSLILPHSHYKEKFMDLLSAGSTVEVSGKTFEVVVDNQSIRSAICNTAYRISEDYEDSPEPVVLLMVLMGGMFLTMDMARALNVFNVHPVFDRMQVSKYYNNRPGKAKIILPPSLNLDGRDVIVCEDIVDTHDTLLMIDEYIKSFNPRRLGYCVLGHKDQEPDIPIEYNLLGRIGSDWLFGYGMDLEVDKNHLYRESLHILKKTSKLHEHSHQVMSQHV